MTDVYISGYEKCDDM